MKTMKAAVLVFLACLLIAGCAQTRQTVVDLAEQDLRNAETSRQVATHLLSTWPLNSGFIRGALGDRISELPMQAIRAMDELDALAAGEGPLTDFELGRSLGLRARMLGEIVVHALEKYAPDVLGMLMGAL